MINKISIEYQTYLQSEKWQNIRQAVLKRDNFRCRLCGSNYNLQVHHINGRYRFKEETALHSLITLCDRCHETIHKYYNQCDELKKGI